MKIRFKHWINPEDLKYMWDFVKASSEIQWFIKQTCVVIYLVQSEDAVFAQLLMLKQDLETLDE